MKKYGFIAASIIFAAITTTLGVNLRMKSKTSYTQPEEDGGVKDNTNLSAPKSISSREITSFYVHFFCEDPDDPSHNGVYRFQISKDDSGKFLLSASGEIKGSMEAKASLLEDVQHIIERHELVKLNGICCVTQGLPVQYSPCSLSAEYVSGEQLSFTTDGCPYSPWCLDLKNLLIDVFT